MLDPSGGASNYCDMAENVRPGFGGGTCYELDLLEANNNAMQTVTSCLGTLVAIGTSVTPAKGMNFKATVLKENKREDVVVWHFRSAVSAATHQAPHT